MSNPTSTTNIVNPRAYADGVATEAGDILYHAKTWRIPESNFGPFAQAISDLNRRATRLGLPGLSLSFTEEDEVVRDPVTGAEEVYVYYNTALIGQTPKLPGDWTLVAVLDHSYVDREDGSSVAREHATIVNTVPGALRDANELAAWRGANGYCEHCRTLRHRTQTFLVRNAEGTITQVGRDCLRDFLGVDVERLAWLAEMVSRIFGAGDDAARLPGLPSATRIGLRDYLTDASCCIRLNGWTSRTKARDLADGTKATVDILEDCRDHMRHCQARGPLDCRQYALYHFTPTEEDAARAEAALAWIAGLDAYDGEYLNNLHTICQGRSFDRKHAALVASLIATHEAAQQRDRERKLAAVESAHVGEIGARETLVGLTVLRIITLAGDWGPTTIYRLVDAAGNRLSWKSSTAGVLQEGQTYDLVATIKAHDEYRGIRETRINRAKVVKTY